MTTPRKPVEPTDLPVTPVDEWPAKKIPEITVLPSGAICKLRKPNVFVLMRTGQVPPRLRAALMKVDEKKIDADPIGALGNEAELMLDWLVASSFVNPVCLMQKGDADRKNRELVAAGRKPTFLWIGQVDEDDKQSVIERLGLRV